MRNMEEDAIEQALELLGSLLEERGFGCEIVVIGGSALLLLDIIHRPTKDLDVLAVVRDGAYTSAQPLPIELEEAAGDVARELGLASDWLNGGPTSQLEHGGLPAGFHARVETRIYRALVVHVASRIDHIYLKLYAAVDANGRGKHADDLRRLAPTRQELLQAAEWVRAQDIGPEFPRMVADTLRIFGVEHDET
jgi:hypothetical protein